MSVELIMMKLAESASRTARLALKAWLLLSALMTSCFSRLV